MVKMVAPTYASLCMDRVFAYSPNEEKVASWHRVTDGRKENFVSIAEQYHVPVERLIEFNFPGSVKSGRVNPDIVNWYLFHHERFRCRVKTHDGSNFMFRTGERVAIPYLGHVEIGEAEIRVPTNTKFKIKMLVNLELTIVVAAGDYSVFTIWDEKASLCSVYSYWAGGASGGLIRGQWLSGTREGPWNDFEVSKPIAVNQFAGPARFTTGGGGPHSKNYLNLMGLPTGVATVPNPLSISTGTTFGAGAGTSIGGMRLEKLGTTDGVLPFKGP